MAEIEKNWLDTLSDQITEMLANPKLVKFNTHKNRKVFTGNLLSLIKDAISKNTVTTERNPLRISMDKFAHPNTNAKKGHAVMTEELSAKGDEVRSQVASNKSARSW